MKTITYKRLLLFVFLILLALLLAGHYAHPRNMVAKWVGFNGSMASANPGFFWGLFQPVDSRHQINAESLEFLSRNSTWRGRPLLSPQRLALSHFWLEDDIAKLQKDLPQGGLDVLSLSKFSMDVYMEAWEWDTLNRSAMTVAMDAGNGSTSTMVIVDRKPMYRVGDFITVRVDIRDGNGKRKKGGGDQVRVWMTDIRNQASQASDVTDMGNGSYISALPLTWAGTATVHASLVYNSEMIRAHFFIRNIAKTTRFMAAGFFSAFSSEATLCSPFPVIPQSKQLCNFTMGNGGSPWYCGKPQSPGLECRHWKYNFDIPFYSPLPLTEAERIWAHWIGKSKYQTISNITIQVGSQRAFTHKRSIPRCGSRALKESWTDSAPRGFFQNKLWHPLRCTLPVMSKATITNCLRNTTFLMLGDSNLRLAFQILLKKIQCQLNTGTIKPRWHSPLYCFNKATNTAVHWKPHGLPFHLGFGTMYADRLDVKHANEYIDEIPSHGRYVILIHLYFHFTPHHYSVYASQIRAVRKSVERLLQRNAQVKVIFRGPHAASHFHDWHGVRGGDLAGLHYANIIRREFKGLYNKVFFLLPWDMTVAMQNSDFHPPDYVNQVIMNLVLDHVCWNETTMI